MLKGHGQLAQDAVPRLLQLAVRPPLFERPSLARRRAQLQLGVKQGHQREELRQLLVGAGPEVVDHGSCCPRTPAHLQALLARLVEDSEAEVAVVALLDRALQATPAAEGFWRGLGLGLGLGLWRGLGHGHGPLGLASFLIALGALVVAVLAELFARCPADRRAHRGFQHPIAAARLPHRAQQPLAHGLGRELCVEDALGCGRQLLDQIGLGPLPEEPRALVGCEAHAGALPLGEGPGLP